MLLRLMTSYLKHCAGGVTPMGDDFDDDGSASAQFNNNSTTVGA
jgi:hypothetical protein